MAAPVGGAAPPRGHPRKVLETWVSKRRFGDFAAVGKVTRRRAAKSPQPPSRPQAINPPPTGGKTRDGGRTLCAPTEQPGQGAAQNPQRPPARRADDRSGNKSSPPAQRQRKGCEPSPLWPRRWEGQHLPEATQGRFWKPGFPNGALVTLPLLAKSLAAGAAKQPQPRPP